MPLPLAPIAGFALRYGAVALASYAVTRKIDQGFRDQRAEDALDDTPEGVTLRQGDDQANATARFRRVFRVGPTGPGFEVDATALGRIRIRRTG
ncbi:hypothetical protein [Actibacterium ureilyticum]|uniref:hypothetical protein n=1 Tax=Actibacterium ureilyticum TaxID=1590614 RepID=UPI000BAB0C41|nr:hypothetical protein [Actibacterium ureilyticum]